MARSRGPIQNRKGAGADGGAGNDEQLNNDDLDQDEDDLDEDDQDDDLDDDDLDDDEDSSEDEDDDEGFDEAKFMGKVTSEIDRRITGLQNKIMRRLDKLAGSGSIEDRRGGEGRQQQRQRQQQPEETPSADYREARAVYRDTVGDLVKFQSVDERQTAAMLAQAFITQRITAGDEDEDEIGENAAKYASKKILELRKQAEERVKANLRRQGILPDQKGGQGGTEGRAGAPGVRSELKKGAAVAERRYPKAGS